MFRTLREDLEAVRRSDPAAHGLVETLLCHTPLHAIWLYRLAHMLHVTLAVPILPRLLCTLGRFWAGVEIHPAACIGRRLFIDHGTGLVIGETAEIGDDCVMFHNVTLGGTGKHQGKRHPTIEDGVLIGTGATLLGPITVGRGAKIGAGSFVRMRDVPAGCTAAGTPARLVKCCGRRVDAELPLTRLPEGSIPVAGEPPGGTRG
jgi:serine O-acetyltransferase